MKALNLKDFVSHKVHKSNFQKGLQINIKLYHIWHSFSQHPFMNEKSANKMCLQSCQRWETAFHFNSCYKRALIRLCHCHSQIMLISTKFAGLNEFVMDLFIKSCKVRYIVGVYLDIYTVYEYFDSCVLFFQTIHVVCYKAIIP